MVAEIWASVISPFVDQLVALRRLLWKFIVTVNVGARECSSIVLHMQIFVTLEAITSRVCFFNDQRMVIDPHSLSNFHRFKAF